jgi:hypothetical protein
MPASPAEVPKRRKRTSTPVFPPRRTQPPRKKKNPAYQTLPSNSSDERTQKSSGDAQDSQKSSNSKLLLQVQPPRASTRSEEATSAPHTPRHIRVRQLSSDYKNDPTVVKVVQSDCIKRTVSTQLDSTSAASQNLGGDDGQEPQVRKTSIVLRHSICSPWRHLPFSNPEEIKLNIAVNYHDARSDVVHYGPQPMEPDMSLMLWERETSVKLLVDRRAAIVVMADEYSPAMAFMLFGKDISVTLTHHENHASVLMLESDDHPNWFRKLLDFWTGGAPGLGQLCVKSVFDGTFTVHAVQSPLELEALRIFGLFDAIKLDFKNKSGLSIPEIEDIFQNRTLINLLFPMEILQNDHPCRAFENMLAKKWRQDLLQLPADCAKAYPNNWFRDFWKGWSVLKAQAGRNSRGLGRVLPALNTFKCQALVLEIDCSRATVSVAETVLEPHRIRPTVIVEKVSNNHGVSQMRRHVVSALTQEEQAWQIRAAETESDTPFDQILQSLVDSFEMQLSVFEGGWDLGLFFPEGVHFTSGVAQGFAVEPGVRLSSGTVRTIVEEWLEPVVTLARVQLQELKDEVAAEDDPPCLAQPSLFMTGYWATIPYVRTAFENALRSTGLADVQIVVDRDCVDPSFDTRAALWAMVANPWRQAEQGRTCY